MRTRRVEPERDAALSRRLAQLGDELSGHPGGLRPARPDPPPAPAPTAAPWWEEHTRPAPPRRPPAPSPVPRPLPGAAATPPGPGRHAARARDRAQVALGSIALGPAQLAVVAIVVAIGLAATCWWLVRGTAHAPAPELTAAPAPALVPTAAGVEPVATGETTSPATVTVDVSGKVRHPGIAVLDAGSRVVDALKAAGGARPGADVSGLNLARVLVDGEQVLVGQPGPAAPAAAAGPPAAGGPGSTLTLVNLNTATEAELDSLPEVGPVTAASILTWRDQHGGFTSVDELLEVDGIGEVTLGRLAPFVTV